MSDEERRADASVRVLAAVPADWARMRALRLRALGDAPDAFYVTLAEEREKPDAYWRERLEKPEVRTLCAELRGEGGAWRDVGLAVVAPTSDDPSVAGLYSVWVAPDARGHGVGAALVAAAFEHAKAAGARRVVLDVGVANGPARRLYERAGFRATGRVFALKPPRDHIIENELAIEVSSLRTPGA